MRQDRLAALRFVLAIAELWLSPLALLLARLRRL